MLQGENPRDLPLGEVAIEFGRNGNTQSRSLNAANAHILSRRKEVQPIQGRCRRFISGFQDSGAPAFKKVHNLFYFLRVYAHLTQCVAKMG